MINKTTALKFIRNLKREYNKNDIKLNLMIGTEEINKKIGYIELCHINPYNLIKMIYFYKYSRF